MSFGVERVYGKPHPTGLRSTFNEVMELRNATKYRHTVIIVLHDVFASAGLVSYHPTNTRSWLSPSQNISRDHPTRVFSSFQAIAQDSLSRFTLSRAVPLDPTPLFFHESRCMTRFLAPKLPEGSYHADPTNPILRYEILINSLSIALSIPRVQL
jgi:hypothetical protein